MDQRIPQILADTQAWGFEFVSENLAKHDVALRNIPVIHVTDSKKFDTLKPGIVQDGLNGTSTHVSSQRVGRDFAYENQRMAEDKRNQRIRELNVEWALGVKTQRTVEVVRYAGPPNEDGTRTLYDTPEEADAAYLEWQSQQ